MSISEDQRVVSWWTPEGWITALEPLAYTKAITSEKVMSNWYGVLTQEGFVQLEGYGDKNDRHQISVWKSGDGELYVTLSGITESFASFFVGAVYRDAFYADRYPKLVLAAAAAMQADALKVIAKTLLAFVRHGQGRTTIDEFGWRSADDMADERAAADARRDAQI